MESRELDLAPIEERVTAYNGQPYMNPDYIRLCNNAHVDLIALIAEVKRLRTNYGQLETHAKWLDKEMTAALKDGGIAREWAYGQDHHEECSCGKEVWPELETLED